MESILENKKVLVVDNNTSAASSLQRMIAYYHYHADIVDTEEVDFRLFSLELFKTLSPIFESYNRRHDRHFAMFKDLKETNEIIVKMSKKIRYLEERFLLLEEKLKKEMLTYIKEVKDEKTKSI